MKLGFFEGAVVGHSCPTADVIRSGLWTGLKKDNLISSSFLFWHPDHHSSFLFADCGVNVQPNSEQLLKIAEQTVSTWNSLFSDPPNLAFLSFSTMGSAKHDSIEPIQQAVEMFKLKNPDVLCDGELQFDAAWNSDIRKKKAPNSNIKEKPNCFVFPNLHAGNIAYKITQQIGGYQAYGPLLQGFSKPLMDLSRGSTTKDIIQTAKIAGTFANTEFSTYKRGMETT